MYGRGRLQAVGCYARAVFKLPWFTTLICLLVGCSTTSSVSNPTPNAIAEKPMLRLLSSLWPPFVDSAENPRLAVDLVSEALRRAGYLPNSEVASLEGVLDGLRSGTYDGSAALWRSDEREQFLLYSNAYLENRLMLVGAKGSPVDAASFKDLAGKKVGLVEGYAYGPEVDEAKDPVFVRAAPSEEENLRALLRGEVDYVLADALVIHHLAQQYPEQTREKLALGTRPLVKRTLHFAVRKNLPSAQGIIDGFNRELARMLTDGAYHQALGVRWIQADVDGDGVPEMVAADDHVGNEAPSSGYPLVSVMGKSASDSVPTDARFVVKGVPYASWQAVPDDYKTAPNPLGSTPTTLRVSIFEF